MVCFYIIKLRIIIWWWKCRRIRRWKGSSSRRGNIIRRIINIRFWWWWRSIWRIRTVIKYDRIWLRRKCLLNRRIIRIIIIIKCKRFWLRGSGIWEWNWSKKYKRIWWRIISLWIRIKNIKWWIRFWWSIRNNRWLWIIIRRNKFSRKFKKEMK